MTVLAVVDPGVSSASREAVALAHRLADSVITVRPPSAGGPGVAGASLAHFIAELEPEGVVAPATDHGMDVLAHVAARLDLPLAANCVAVSSGESWSVTRSRGGGVLLEEAVLNAPTKLLTLAPGAIDPATELPEVIDLSPVVDDPAPKAQLVERAAAGSGVTLATAPVVVSGGRGVGSAENFAVLDELAALLGGAVGCSRVVTNNGWRPHSDQVGQTGTKVAPDLYIAAGISGATQHWAGCMNSKTILAINTDPQAPMMTRAHYAVVGDAVEVLRAVVTELHRRRDSDHHYPKSPISPISDSG